MQPFDNEPGRQECHPCKIHFSTNRRSRSFKLERGEIEAHMQREPLSGRAISANVQPAS